MTRSITLALILAGGLAIPVSSSAAQIDVFTTVLSGSEEVPPTASPATGIATITIDEILQTMRVEVSFAGLTSPDVAAHIHCCAPPGTTGPVATLTPAFPGFPLGVTSGTYDQTLTSPNLFNVGFITNHGGTEATAFADFLNGLQAGNAYFNIHTQTFPAGEIRGQLQAVHDVPEPATWAMMLVGFGAVGASLRVRRRETGPIALG